MVWVLFGVYVVETVIGTVAVFDTFGALPGWGFFAVQASLIVIAIRGVDLMRKT